MKRPSILFAAAASLCLGTIAPAASARADLFTLSSDPNNGDGYVLPANATGFPFDLFGADNNIGPVVTSFTATALQDETLSLQWKYTTHDSGGSYWDPAGYEINGMAVNLSYAGLPFGASLTGDLTLSLQAGDNYGFYVNSLDSLNGRGELAVATPEPALSALMLAATIGVCFASIAQRAERSR